MFVSSWLYTPAGSITPQESGFAFEFTITPLKTADHPAKPSWFTDIFPLDALSLNAVVKMSSTAGSYFSVAVSIASFVYPDTAFVCSASRFVSSCPKFVTQSQFPVHIRQRISEAGSYGFKFADFRLIVCHGVPR